MSDKMEKTRSLGQEGLIGDTDGSTESAKRRLRSSIFPFIFTTYVHAYTCREAGNTRS